MQLTIVTTQSGHL